MNASERSGCYFKTSSFIKHNLSGEAAEPSCSAQLREATDHKHGPHWFP